MGASLSSRQRMLLGVALRLILGIPAGPLAGAGGLGGEGGAGQVVGLTALGWGRDDRGRGRSPRLSGLVRAA
jgi:hypothetical protein